MRHKLKHSFHILLADKDFGFSSKLAQKLKDEFDFLDITWVSDPYSAMNHLVERYHDLVILEWDFPEMNGTRTLDKVDKALSMEEALPHDWLRNKVPVALLTSTEAKPLSIRRSRKFFHVKRILSKKQSLSEIVSQLKPQIETYASAGSF